MMRLRPKMRLIFLSGQLAKIADNKMKNDLIWKERKLLRKYKASNTYDEFYVARVSSISLLGHLNKSAITLVAENLLQSRGKNSVLYHKALTILLINSLERVTFASTPISQLVPSQLMLFPCIH